MRTFDDTMTEMRQSRSGDRSCQETALPVSARHPSTDGSCDWLNFSKAARTVIAGQPSGTESRSLTFILGSDEKCGRAAQAGTTSFRSRGCHPSRPSGVNNGGERESAIARGHFGSRGAD